jgi:hypothetical protein
MLLAGLGLLGVVARRRLMSTSDGNRTSGDGVPLNLESTVFILIARYLSS